MKSDWHFFLFLLFVLVVFVLLLGVSMGIPLEGE
jgi:hypothetical protein